MKTIFEMITLKDAIALYSIDEHMYESREMFEDQVETGTQFYLHKGDLVLDDHFMMEYDQEIHGYIIDGNLRVNGNIINEEGDYGPCLYVKGNVECRSLLIGGSPTHIESNVTAEEVIMLHYNHGWMKCPGVFTAPVMIVEDYHFIPAHKNISGYYYNAEDPANTEEYDFDNDTFSSGLKALLDNKLTTTFEELRYDLAAGEYVLQPSQRDIHYWTQKVNHNYRDLKRVPPEMRTLEFCMQVAEKSIFALEHFPPALFTPELADQIVSKNGMALRFIPESLITRELCYKAAATGAIIDQDIPERFYDATLFQMLIRRDDWQMARIPPAYITEDLLVLYVQSGNGGWLEKYCKLAGVSKEHVLQRVIDSGIEYVENIFSWFLTEERYAYCKSKYGHTKEWAEITEKYKKKLERIQ